MSVEQPCWKQSSSTSGCPRPPLCSKVEPNHSGCTMWRWVVEGVHSAPPVLSPCEEHGLLPRFLSQLEDMKQNREKDAWIDCVGWECKCNNMQEWEMWSFFACRYQVLLCCSPQPHTVFCNSAFYFGCTVSEHASEWFHSFAEFMQSFCACYFSCFSFTKPESVECAKHLLSLIFCCKRRFFWKSDICVSRNFENCVVSSQNNPPHCAIKNVLHIFKPCFPLQSCLVRWRGQAQLNL